MPKPKELALVDAYKKAGCIHELKIDGTSMDWTGFDLMSDRGIVRNDRFPHIVTELEQIQALVAGEIAIPGGNVHQVSASENWPKARFYIYDVLDYKGKDYTGADPSTVRRVIDEILRSRFDHLRSPMFFNSFKQGWDFVCKTRNKGQYAEGIVLKEISNGRQYKVKYNIEEKLPIVGHVPGALKGAFLVERDGVTCKVSAGSVGFVKMMNDLLAAGEKPYAEIEYLFLTDGGKMFQPRLRRVGTLSDLKSVA